MDMSKRLAKLRLWYHVNILDVNNCLNQIGLMTDEQNEQSNKNHCMIIFNDIFPRLGYDISQLKKRTE